MPPETEPEPPPEKLRTPRGSGFPKQIKAFREIVAVFEREFAIEWPDLGPAIRGEDRAAAARFLFSTRIADRLPVPIVATTGNGQLVLFNKMAEEICGFSLDEVAEQGWIRIAVRNTGDEHLRASWFSSGPAGVSSHEQEWTVTRKGGEKRILSFTVTQIKNNREEPLAALAIGQDITERRVLQQELEQSRGYLSDVVRNAGIGILTLDEKGYIRLWNEALEAQMGYRAPEIIGEHVSKLIPQELQEECSEVLERAIKGEVVRDVETLRIHKDGRKIPMSLTLSALRDSRGSPEILVFCRDVEEERALRNELAESKRYLSNVIQNAGIGIVGLDARGHVRLWNEAMEDILGYKASEILGEFVSKLHPPDAWEDARSIFRRASRGEVIRDFETIRLRKDGRRVPVSLTVSALHTSEGCTEVHGFVRDITEQKRLEEEVQEYAQRLEGTITQLRRSESKYFNLIDQANDGIVVFDHEGCVLIANRRIREMLHRGRSALLGRNILDLFPDAVRKAGQAAIERVIRERSVVFGEMPIGLDNGHSVRVEVSASVIRHGDAELFQALFRDVSERRRLERKIASFSDQLEDTRQELRENEEKYYNLFEHANDGIAVTDEKGMILEANERMVQFLGYPREQLIGRDVVDLVSQRSRKKFRACFGNFIEERAVLVNDIPFRRSDGTEFEGEMSATVIQAGERLYVQGIVRDVGERRALEREIKETKKRLESLIEQAREGIVTFDRNLRVGGWNSAAEEIFEAGRQAVIGQHLSTGLSGMPIAEIEKAARRVLEGRKTETRVSPRVRHDGTRSWLDLSMSPVRSSEGEVTGVLMIIRDVTEEWRIRREKDALLEDVSRELGQPLAKLEIASEMLTSDLEKVETRYAIDQTIHNMLLNNVAKLRATVQEIFEATQVELNRSAWRSEPVDFSSIVRAETAAAGETARSKGLGLECDFEQDAPSVTGDPEQLARAVRKLLDNAVKYTDRGSIEVSLARKERGMRFTVKDTGRGIDRNTLSKLLGRSAQAERGSSRVPLGLVMSRRIAEHHGGRLHIQSDGPGTGTEVELFLPAASA